MSNVRRMNMSVKGGNKCLGVGGGANMHLPFFILSSFDHRKGNRRRRQGNEGSNTLGAKGQNGKRLASGAMAICAGGKGAGQ